MQIPAYVREVIGAILLVIGAVAVLGGVIRVMALGDPMLGLVLIGGLVAWTVGRVLAWREVPEEPPR